MDPLHKLSLGWWLHVDSLGVMSPSGGDLHSKPREIILAADIVIYKKQSPVIDCSFIWLAKVY